MYKYNSCRARSVIRDVLCIPDLQGFLCSTFPNGNNSTLFHFNSTNFHPDGKEKREKKKKNRRENKNART